MWQDCIILELRFRTDLVTSVVDNVIGLHHPWILSPKEIQILQSLYCGLLLLLMMMMFLIERLDVATNDDFL